MVEMKIAAEAAFNDVVKYYALTYEKATDCLAKDRDTLLAVYHFPAE